jgi:hypothetical protein
MSLIQGTYSATLPTLTDNQNDNVQVDNRGRLRVIVESPTPTPSTASMRDAADVTITAGVATALFAVAPVDTIDRALTIQASPSNTETIRLGGSTVSSSRGIQLAPGQAYLVDMVSNPVDVTTLFAFAVGAGQTVSLAFY